MLSVAMLRGLLRALSTMFGSLGILFLYLSFVRPAMGACALLFLGCATAIVWSSQ